MEVETAPGQVLVARSIRQTLADAKFYAPGIWCGPVAGISIALTLTESTLKKANNTYGGMQLKSCHMLCLALIFTAVSLPGPVTPTHVAKIHDECEAQIRSWPT